MCSVVFPDILFFFPFVTLLNHLQTLISHYIYLYFYLYVVMLLNIWRERAENLQKHIRSLLSLPRFLGTPCFSFIFIISVSSVQWSYSWVAVQDRSKIRITCVITAVWTTAVLCVVWGICYCLSLIYFQTSRQNKIMAVNISVNQRVCWNVYRTDMSLH